MSRAIIAKQLRSFGFTVGGIFAAIGLWPLILRGDAPRYWALLPAILLLIPALVYPLILAPVFKGWMAVGHVLGWVNTRVILGAIFYLLMTPMGVVRRLLGKDSVSRDFDPTAKSYRIPKSQRPPTHVKYQY